MRSAVVDTNVLVRAFLKPDSSDGKVVYLAFKDELRLWYSNKLLTELIRVLFYPRFKKYNVTQERMRVFIDSLISHGNNMPPLTVQLCRDPDDNEILGVAMAVAENNPVVLVSADKERLVLKGHVEGIEIITPQELLKTL